MKTFDSRPSSMRTMSLSNFFASIVFGWYSERASVSRTWKGTGHTRLSRRMTKVRPSTSTVCGGRGKTGTESRKGAPSLPSRPSTRACRPGVSRSVSFSGSSAKRNQPSTTGSPRCGAMLAVDIGRAFWR